jgi:hypothetical protein
MALRLLTNADCFGGVLMNGTGILVLSASVITTYLESVSEQQWSICQHFRSELIALCQGPAIVIDLLGENLLDAFSSQRRVFIQIPDDFSAQCPQVIDVLLNRFGRQIRGDQIFQEGPETSHQPLARWQVFFPPHPRTRPRVQPTAVTLQQGRRDRGGAVYGSGFGYRSLPRHGTHHDSKPLPSLPGICLSSRHIQSGP